MVRSSRSSRESRNDALGRVQSSDSDRRHRHLRNRAEKSSLAELSARPLQHQAGSRGTRVSSHVRRNNEFRARSFFMSSLTLLQSLHKNFSTRARAKSFFGEPVTAGDKTIIPVAKIAYGFGAGAGTGSCGMGDARPRGEGGGGGGGVRAIPIGVFEVGPRETRFVAIQDRKKLAGTLLLGAALGLLFGRRRRRA